MKNHLSIGVLLMCLGVGALLGGVGSISHGYPVAGSSLLGVSVFGIALAWRALVPSKQE